MPIVPRPLGQVLGDAMNALARVWRPLSATALIVFLPIGVITFALFQFIDGATEFLDLVFTDPNLVQSLPAEDLLEMARPFLTAVGIAMVIQALGTIFLYLATARIVAVDAAGERTSGSEARAYALRHYGGAVVASVIVLVVVGVALGLGLAVWSVPLALVGTPNATSSLIAFVLLIALAGPGIWLWVSFSMFLAALSIERLGALTSLRRSYALVKGRWWPTLGFLVLVGLLGFVAVQLIQLVAIPLAAVGSIESGLSIASMLGIVSQGLIVAGYGAMYSAWYIDLRSRKETLTAAELS